MMSQQEAKPLRLGYIDTAKVIGMFCIYFGHSISWGTPYSAFFYYFHVPLFFFLSGCTESLGRTRPFREYALRKVRQILLPCLVFAIAGICVEAFTVHVNGCLSGGIVAGHVIDLLFGCIHNHYIDGQLWFLTCIFVMSLLFQAIVRLKNRYLMLAVCLLASILYPYLPVNPLIGGNEPAWFWNLDLALFYLPYYCIGYLLFPYIRRLFEGNKLTVLILGLVTLLYSISIFYQKNPLDRIAFSWAPANQLMDILRILPMCLHILIVAWYLSGIRVLQRWGQNSLYLCGSEGISGKLFFHILQLFSLTPEFYSPLTITAYIGLRFYCTDRFLVPVWKSLVAFTEGQFQLLLPKKTKSASQ